MRQANGEDCEHEVDTLPIEDRYLHDGAQLPPETAKFGLHTGKTRLRIPRQDPQQVESANVGESELIGEMKRGRYLYIALLVGGAALLGGALVVLV